MPLGNSNASIDTTAKSLVEHWRWVADKGLMNANTANALRGASLQVLSVLDDWEAVDVSTLDIEDVCRRFRNKRNRDFKPDSLDAYQKRFATAVRMFLEYVANPAGWKTPVSKERPPLLPKSPGKSTGRGKPIAPADDDIPEEVHVNSKAKGPNLIDFPFPLREGVLAVLSLPADLKLSEVARLNGYLKSLAVDGVQEA